MPELDYMVVADYVRADGGVIHIMSAGIDTVQPPVVPTVHPVGVALRITFGSDEEVDSDNSVRITFQSADGEQLLVARAGLKTPSRSDGLPEHWRTGLGFALQMPIPLPRYGDYSFELDINDGQITKSIDFRVIQPMNVARS